MPAPKKTPDAEREGQELKRLREATGMRQRDMAEKLGWGVSSYQLYEQGRVSLKTWMVKPIAAALNISEGDLSDALGFSGRSSSTVLGRGVAEALHSLADAIAAIADDSAEDQAGVLEAIANHHRDLRDKHLAERRA